MTLSSDVSMPLLRFQSSQTTVAERLSDGAIHTASRLDNLPQPAFLIIRRSWLGADYYVRELLDRLNLGISEGIGHHVWYSAFACPASQSHIFNNEAFCYV